MADLTDLKKPLALALTAAMLAGCGGSSASGATSTDGAASGGSASGDASTVTVAIDADLNTMDYEIATDGNSFIMQSLVMSGLTELAADGSPLPELAESWDVSDDGLVYTFHLADAKWSNGDPVTASDFVYAWQRLDNPDTASEYAFILDTVHIANAAAVNAGEADPSELGVKAVDDKTLEVTLMLPCDFFLSLLAFPSFFPLNQKFYEEQGDQFALSPDNLLYCGPYTMTGYQQGSEYTFEKNPDYFKADQMTDYVDKIVFRYLQDTQSAMLDYQSGNLDVVKLQGDQVDQYSGTEGFTNRMTGYLWYLSIDFNTSVHPENSQFANLNLRKAMSLAIDRDTIAANVLKDGSIGADGLIPKDLATGPSGEDFRAENGKLTEYNLDQAKEYYAKALEELGTDTVSFELLYEDSEASKAVAEYIQSNLKAIGMDVTLNSKPKKTRLQLMNDKDYNVALTRWGPDYADPETYFDLFTTDNTANNSGSYSNADYDALVKAAGSGEDATDSAKRWQDYLDAEKIIVQDDPGVIPVYQNGGAMMINPKVTGIEFHSASVDSYRHIKKAA
ncbi:MAG: peptide ABC transporter substrate-binding protein [Galactobacillus timonensis]|uniref:peptide ABC transporter substrate-binding protein n=1 Tax=Galactobacillus timonensis TaxID=2041840 RepID=UPI002409A3E0|nr:peptide ABC transporter substrate-binding protein [Galactobacillus timonensis]MDD6599980.1 peptide ABC transporter substrate-binding protein [Galactobacillus timonensis]